MVGGVHGRAVGAQLQLPADEQRRARRFYPAGRHGHDDAHGDLAAHACAVLGIGVDLRDAGGDAAHGDGAVQILAHLGDLLVGDLPGELLRHVFAGIVGAERRGAQRQVAGTDVDFSLVAAHLRDLDLVGGDGHRGQAVVRKPVVGGGGDDGRAIAHAGDHAVFHGGDVLVAGLPGEVGGIAIGGVRGRAIGPQHHGLADEQLGALGDVEAGDRHDDGDGDLAVHAGAVLGGGIHAGRAGGDAAHRAGAVGVVAHLKDVGVAGAPGEVLADMLIVAQGVGGRGAQRQVAGADVDVGPLAVHGFDGDLPGRHGHRDDAHLGHAVVGSGGNGGGAGADGGQFALAVHGDYVFVAALPGKVSARAVSGVGGRDAEIELLFAADEQLHHAGINGEALHRHDDAHGDLAGDAAAVRGVGVDAHDAGGDAGHGAGAVAVDLHAGIARVGGFPGEVLLHTVGGAVRAIGGGAQRQVGLAHVHFSLARAHRIDDDRAHGVGDLHQAGGIAAVERARDQAHLAGLFAGERAVCVHAGRAGQRFHRPEDGAGLGVAGGEDGREALALAHGELRRGRQRHGRGHLAHIDLRAHRLQRAGPGGDRHRAGSAERLHERAVLRRGDGGDARIAAGPGDGQFEHRGRAELEAERGILVEIERILGAHRGVVVVEHGAQDRRVERHLRAEDGAGHDLAALRAEGGYVVVAELAALGVPAHAGLAAGEHPAVEHLAVRRFRLGQVVERLGGHGGKRAAAQQLVIAAVEGDDHALFALLRLGGGGIERGQLQTRLAGGGDGVAIPVKRVDGRGVGDQRRIGVFDEGVERQRARLEERAVGQLPAGKHQPGAGAGRGHLHGLALAEIERLRIALVAQKQLDGIGGLHLRAFRIGAVAGEAHRGRQHQAGKAAFVEFGIVRHVAEAHGSGVGLVEHALAVGIPAVDGAAGAEDGEIIAEALAGVVVEYVVAVAFVGLIAAGEGDGLVRGVLVNAHARARARPGAGVEHHLDHALFRLALKHRREIDLHRGQPVVEHDARHGDHLQDLVIGQAGGLRAYQRSGAGGGVEIAAHIVFHAPAGEHLALELHVDGRERDALAAGGEALIALVALGVGDGHVEYDGLFLVGGDDQRGAHSQAVGRYGLSLRARLDERLQFAVTDGRLAGRPAPAARKRPSGAGHAVWQCVGKGDVLVAGGERHRADGLAAVGEDQLQIRLLRFRGAVRLVVGANFQAPEAALGHRQTGGHRAKALHQLFIAERRAGLEAHAVQIGAAVYAAPVNGIARALSKLRDGLGAFAGVQAHAGQLLKRPILVVRVLIEGENDALFAVALDIHVNAGGIRPGLHAALVYVVVRQRRLVFGKRVGELAVGAGQHPGRPFGQHVGQSISRVRGFWGQRQRLRADALLLVLPRRVIECDVIDRQLVFDLKGRAQIDDDRPKGIGALKHLRSDQIVKGHGSLAGRAEETGLVCLETLPAGVRIGLVGGQHRQCRVRAAFHQRRFQQKRAGVAVVNVEVDDAQRRALVHAAHVQRRVGGGEQLQFAHGQLRVFRLRRFLRRLDGRLDRRLRRRLDRRLRRRLSGRLGGRLSGRRLRGRVRALDRRLRLLAIAVSLRRLRGRFLRGLCVGAVALRLFGFGNDFSLFIFGGRSGRCLRAGGRLRLFCAALRFARRARLRGRRLRQAQRRRRGRVGSRRRFCRRFRLGRRGRGRRRCRYSRSLRRRSCLRRRRFRGFYDDDRLAFRPNGQRAENHEQGQRQAHDLLQSSHQRFPPIPFQVHIQTKYIISVKSCQQIPTPLCDSFRDLREKLLTKK